MYKILHIAPHYGGGVGSVMRSWADRDKNNTHTMSYLNDVPENRKPGQSLYHPDMVHDADFVVCHVWNHPALFDFLVKSDIPPCRLIGWSHMSGLYPPYILFDRLVHYFDEFIYTSPISNMTGISKNHIWSCRDISEFLTLQPNPHDGFNVGFIGTLDYCKIHPAFIDICSRIDIPDVHFTIIGDGGDAKDMRNETARRGIDDLFTFTGIVDDVKPYLQTFDVFLYPLYNKHFGTCEQVLGEALASGLPCVVMDNMAEEYIIEHGINGFICQSINDVAGVVRDIYKGHLHVDPVAARASASRLYSIDKKVKAWNDVFNGLINMDKRKHAWYNIFLESLGECGDIIRRALNYNNTAIIHEIFDNNRQWKSKSKGSVTQYLDYFKRDILVRELMDIL